MGNLNSNELEMQLQEFKDPNNITVVIEKEKSSSISSQAEGTFIIPITTNCVKIADLIFSLVQTPIVLYLCGQDYTHNYTPLSMLGSLMEDDCLHLVYSEKNQFGKGSVMIDEYIKPVDIIYEGPLRLVLKPKQNQTGRIFKIQPWDACTIKQLELILSRISNVPNIKILHKGGPIPFEKVVKDLREFVQPDGLVHLKYTY